MTRLTAVRERHENQALHLGTYEAAIESMLRKMRDEDAGGASSGSTGSPSATARGSSPATATRPRGNPQITQEELGDWGAIRYLNTWESPGSISLAVRPQSLAAVQGIALPVQALSAGAAPSLVREVARIRDHISQIEATRQDEPDQLEEAQAAHGRTAGRRSRENPRPSSRPSTRGSAS